MRAFRIADHRFQVLDGTGAKLSGGRWNTPGRPVVYAAETFAGAMLEVLVHLNLNILPRKYSYRELWIPETITPEKLDGERLLGWDAPSQDISRAFGDQWLREARSLVLMVPSVVTCGIESNLLINPRHPDFRMIGATDPKVVGWDERLFARRKSATEISLAPYR